MVQYEVMSEFVKEMSMHELELFLDGTCGILLKHPEDSMEELTCVIHHVLTKSQLYHNDRDKQIILCRPLAIENIPNFLKIYGDLPKQLEKSFCDCVVRIIPMFSELLKLILRTNPHEDKWLILKYARWTQKVASKLLELICKNIDEVIRAQSKAMDFETIPYEQEENAELKKKLIDQAVKTFNCNSCPIKLPASFRPRSSSCSLAESSTTFSTSSGSPSSSSTWCTTPRRSSPPTRRPTWPSSGTTSGQR
jgi:hypothetical protein